MSEENKTENKSGLKSFKDIKSIDELDFDKIELKVGETPTDIKDTCLQLCQDYLSDNWCQQTVHTIEVRRITGGLINQLYYCGIKQQVNLGGVPQEVAIKLYGENLFAADDKERIKDVVISLILSENNLGTKIYGLFETGQIQKFYKHRQFKTEEQNNPEIVEQVFRTLAKIHSLKPPLKRNHKWIIQMLDNIYEEVFERFPINDFIEEYNCQTLKKYDLKTEIDWIRGVVERVDSPPMFTHYDYRSSNLLITEPNDELVVCDYDVSGYGYRGYDFVALFREWGRKQFEIKYIEGLPINEEFKPLIEIYVEECQQIYGKSYSQNPINSVKHILKEVKTFLLFSYLFGTVFCLKNDENDKDFPLNRQLIMEFAENSFKNYFSIKEILRQQNIID